MAPIIDSDATTVAAPDADTANDGNEKARVSELTPSIAALENAGSLDGWRGSAHSMLREG
jgi:hypothetical protein